MSGQKRTELLTKTERDRLVTRRDMKDTKKRIANDARVKKKLSAWMDNLDDVKLILANLPEEQSSAAIDESDIYQILDIVSDLLKIKKFRVVDGEVNNQDSWQTAPSRPATKLDIARSAIMTIFFEGIGRYLGAKNPILHVMGLLKFYIDPRLQGRLKAEETGSVEKCIAAVNEIYGIDLKEIYEKPLK